MSGGRQPGSGFEEAGSEVAFFGKITASVTHELNNVLSIVEQNAGLLDDMIAGEERGVPLSLDRLKGVSSSVQKQTQRGLEMVARLNRFAHTTDRDDAAFDANEVLSNFASLCRRLALLKKLDLEFRPASTVLKLKGNPFFLQQILFIALQEALAGAAGGCTIVVENRVDSKGSAICISYTGSAKPDRDRMAAIDALVRQMDGTAELEEGDGRILVCLRFALRSPNAGAE
jgi:C4-dicarboxylate-specific signal transduction histidine kinase